jgi:hypothetical protein
MDQRLVTRKNRKLRRLRALFPGVDVSIVYQRDYHQLLVKYGLERPDQDRDRLGGVPPALVEPLGLLGTDPVEVGEERPRTA